MSTKVITGKVRFSYANVFEPTAMEEGQEPKYSVTLLIPKSDKATVKKILAAIEAAKEQDKGKWNGSIPKNLKNPFRDGDEEKEDDEVYAGHYFVNAKSNRKPQIVDENLDEIMSKDDFYSGCYGRASITFYGYSNVSKGIGCSLNNLQKLEDGDRLGAEISTAADDFGDDLL